MLVGLRLMLLTVRHWVMLWIGRLLLQVALTVRCRGT